MARACETRALLLLMLCEGVMSCGQCSSPPHFLEIPRELHPTTPALEHHTGTGGTPAHAKS